MIRRFRRSLVAFLAGVGVFATAGPAAAQFGGGYLPLPTAGLPILPGVGGLRPLPGVGAIRNPLNFHYYQRLNVSIGPIRYSQAFYGPVGYWLYSNNNFPGYHYNRQYTPMYTGYMSGSAGQTNVNPAVAAGFNRNFGVAQRQAMTGVATPAPRNAIYNQWAYEKLGVAGLPELKLGADTPEMLAKAMAVNDESELANGDALNHILTAIVAVEKKGAKGEAAYLPPNLLADVRFTGSPTAEAVNLLREAGKLEFPAAFDTPQLANRKPQLERAFAAATAPVLAGRPADSTRVAALETTAKNTRTTLDPLIKELGFEDAIAVRKFLNQVDAAVTALKAPGSAGLIDRRWTTEGTNVADLVNYMARNHLLFGRVAAGDADAYAALHRGLVGYYTTLLENQKNPRRK